jgi:hypothetical protein
VAERLLATLFASAPAASGGDGRKAAQLVWAAANPIKIKIYSVYIARLRVDMDIKTKMWQSDFLLRCLQGPPRRAEGMGVKLHNLFKQ